MKRILLSNNVAFTLVHKAAHSGTPIAVCPSINNNEKYFHAFARQGGSARLSRCCLLTVFNKFIGKSISAYSSEKNPQAAKGMIHKGYDRKLLFLCDQASFFRYFMKAVQWPTMRLSWNTL